MRKEGHCIDANGEGTNTKTGQTLFPSALEDAQARTEATGNNSGLEMGSLSKKSLDPHDVDVFGSKNDRTILANTITLVDDLVQSRMRFPQGNKNFVQTEDLHCVSKPDDLCAENYKL